MNNDNAAPNGAAASYSQIQPDNFCDSAPQRQASGNSFAVWLNKYIHSWDLFAKPITLKYDKKPAFTTMPGGIISMVFLTLYLSFSLTSLVDFILHSDQVMSDNNEMLSIFDKDEKNWDLPTDTLNLMHLISSDNQTILDELDMYVGSQYVQVDTDYDSKQEGYFDSGNCVDVLGEEKVNALTEQDISFKFYAQKLKCPKTDHIKLRASNLLTEIFKSQAQDNEQLAKLRSAEFRLVINTCHDIYGDSQVKCKSKEEIEYALKQIYVDINLVSQYLSFNNDTGLYEAKMTISQPERYFLGNMMSNLVEKEIKEKKITQNHDWMFGTSLLQSEYKMYRMTGQEQRSFQRVQLEDIKVHPIDPTLAAVNHYLLTVRLKQDKFRNNIVIHPVSFYQFVSLIFAFWFLLLNIGRQTLQKYLGFVWGKSVINKMYFYSRQKQGMTQNVDIKEKNEIEELDQDKEQEDGRTPQFQRKEIPEKKTFNQPVAQIQSYVSTEKQYLEDKNQNTNLLNSIVSGGFTNQQNDDTRDSNESQIDSPEMGLRKKLFRAVMNSKSHLYFGYKHTYLLKFFRYFKCLCCGTCCFTKHCKRKFQKYTLNEKRMKNAGAKMNEDLDLINIVKKLRVGQFIANLTLSPYQQQAIDYFYEYSLENKYAKAKEWKQLDRAELIEMINNNMHNPINQLINQKVVGAVDSDEYQAQAMESEYTGDNMTLMRESELNKKSLWLNPATYIDQHNQDESSEEHDHVELKSNNVNQLDNLFSKQQSYLESKGHSLFVPSHQGVTQYTKSKTKKKDHRSTFGNVIVQNQGPATFGGLDESNDPEDKKSIN